MKPAAMLVLLAAAWLPAQAQQQPYAGHEAREIKSLSAEEVKRPALSSWCSPAPRPCSRTPS